MVNEIAEKYGIDNGQIYEIETGRIVTSKEVRREYEHHVYDQFMTSAQDLINIGEKISFKMVKDRRGNEYQSRNVKEGFHFVKVFKVDMREMLEVNQVSIFSRGFLYSCLAYLQFPTNTLVLDGESPTNEKICEKFKIGKTKLYEVYKELEKLDVIRREKVNGQMVIYLNPFLHSCGLVDKNTYDKFKDTQYNPHPE
jgi:hypothetical protein